MSRSCRSAGACVAGSTSDAVCTGLEREEPLLEDDDDDEDAGEENMSVRVVGHSRSRI
jgi:hypothetical protein